MKITRNGYEIEDLAQNWTCALHTSKCVLLSSRRQKCQVKFRREAGRREKHVFMVPTPWSSNSASRHPRVPRQAYRIFQMSGEIQRHLISWTPWELALESSFSFKIRSHCGPFDDSVSLWIWISGGRCEKKQVLSKISVEVGVGVTVSNVTPRPKRLCGTSRHMHPIPTSRWSSNNEIKIY